MNIERIGVDESVRAVFPPERLVEALSDVPVDVAVVDGSVASLTDREAVVTLQYREAFLDLEWVHSIQAGVDRFPQTRIREAGVTLTNSTGIHGDAIGETVAAYVLALARRLHDHLRNQERGQWSRPDWDDTWTVAGKRACVVGLGGLGRGIVDRLDALGLDVVGVRRTPLPEPGVKRVYPTDALDEAIADVRFVVLAVPLTDSTRGIIGSDAFDTMREDAYLINVARGGVVDQSALISALQESVIAGAALDVFESEPLPETSPLWQRDDVIVSPHSAGTTRDYYVHIAALVRESVRRVHAGDDPANRVV